MHIARLARLSHMPGFPVGGHNYVSPSTVERLVHKYKTTGNVRSVQEKHGPNHKLSDQEELIVLQLFLDKPELYDATGTWVDCSTLCVVPCVGQLNGWVSHDRK